MITAEEYRAWAEESLEWALHATNESSRQAFIRWAEIWLESALQVERIAALQEHLSKEPLATAEHVWQLSRLAAQGHAIQMRSSVCTRECLPQW
jgi:hemolysin-activating ACP:hemolysin acyltransferase